MTWITTCAREGCDRGAKVRGYCRSHYAVANKWGEFDIPPRLSTEERFWSKVEKTATCWLWRAAIHYSGYGHFNPTPKRTVRAHRFSYELMVGPIPEGFVLDHLCRVRNCVNPRHLEVVTPSENSKRTRRPTCAKGHEFATTVSNGRERRYCRECRRAHEAAKREQGWAER